MNNGNYYVGSTTDIERRYAQHQNRCVTSTKRYLPLKLLYYTKYATLKEARQVEYWLKKQKNRKQIEKFIIE